MNEFAPSHRIFVSYIDKSREYYLARGYENPYRWAHHEDVPFAPLTKPLNKSRAALISTAALPGENRSLMKSTRAHRTAAGRPLHRPSLVAQGDHAHSRPD